MGTTADKLQNILDSKNAIKTAIEDKGIPDVGDVLSEYAEKIASIQTGNSGWTGHADVEGLKAIGWTDEDIAYYQKYGVNWNEEDDEYHKVPQDNIDLYDVINIDNIQDYKDKIIYLPKIEIGEKTSMSYKFNKWYSLIALPLLDLSKVEDASNMFNECRSLVLIPAFNLNSANTIGSMCNSCSSLIYIPDLNLRSNVTLKYVLSNCNSIKIIKFSDNLEPDDISYIAQACYSCAAILGLNMKNTISASNAFSKCYSLRYLTIKNLNISINISDTNVLEKESLLYIINNSTPTEAIIITLSAYCYNKYSVDPDVIAALENQPLVTLASA